MEDPRQCARLADGQPIAVFDDNRPLFYLVGPDAWHRALARQAERPAAPPAPAAKAAPAAASRMPIAAATGAASGRAEASIGKASPSVPLDSFAHLGRDLLQQEGQRVMRGEYSPMSLQIMRNRLDAHVYPHFEAIPPSEVTALDLDGFLARLTRERMSSTTVSQYLVLLRKLLKLARKRGVIGELPEMPKVKVVSRPRSMLSLSDYRAMLRTARRLHASGTEAPLLKSSDGQRRRFWVGPRYLRLPRSMAWVIGFMVNSFIRPSDLRNLRHEHVQVVRGENTYLRLTLPESKRHDKPIVTMRPAVRIYEACKAEACLAGQGAPSDYVFLPQEPDREHALAILGFWFKWVLRESGVSRVDHLNRERTLYSLRHTAIMFRLLYGHGIDMLTLARNARTSVQMIERFYASALSGEMNVALLQSKRPVRTG